MMGMSVIFSAVLLMLSGCSNKEFHLGWYEPCIPTTLEKVIYKKHDIPSKLLTVSPMPKVPEATKQSQVAQYTVELWVVADECTTNLDKIKELVETNTTQE